MPKKASFCVIINFTLQHFISDLSLQGTFWTSGIALNVTGEYEWCTLRVKNEVKEFWDQGMPRNNSGECVKIMLQADGAPVLQNAKCSTKTSFICEVECTHT
jgi:Lectin C-type domain